MRTVTFLCLLLISFCINGCGAHKNENRNDTYKIIRYKSYKRYGVIPTGTFITLDFYNFKNRERREPAFFTINRIIFDDSYLVEDDLKPVIKNVFPGSFDIEGYSPITLITRINNLKIEEGDSVVVKIYLKENPHAYAH